MRRAGATARRVLQQLRHDPRSVAMIILVPPLLMLLFKYIFNDQPAVFDRAGPQMLGLFPFILMFILTSVTMVRERASGTLERLLTTPIRRIELLSGYALAFGLAALIQALATSAVAMWALGLSIAKPALVILFAVLDALLGTVLGLLISAFARTEFQAVQFMPAIVVPQILLCGIFVPRAQMPEVLSRISDVLPLSYVTDAFSSLANGDSGIQTELAIVIGFCLAAVVLASLTLRRSTP